MKRPLAVISVAVLVGCVALVGCSPNQTQPTPTGAGVSLIAPGTLTVCTHLPFEPMESRDTNGAVVGFDFDLMGLVANQLGVTVTAVEVDPAQMSSGAAMVAMKCDIAAEGMTITDARKGSVTFSIPYFSVDQTLAVPSSSPVSGLADLKGMNLGVLAAVTGEDYAKAHEAEYGYRIVSFDDSAALMNSLLTGRADAVLYDSSFVGLFISQNAGAKIATLIPTGEVYGFATARTPAGEALINVVNDVLQTANSNGAYLGIYQKWIDPTATSASLPPNS